MNLHTYLRGLPDDKARDDFAAACGTSAGHLRNVSYGQKPLSPVVCAAVEKFSGAAVVCEDLRPDLQWTRIRDKAWPHRKGRPVHDVAAEVGQ